MEEKGIGYILLVVGVLVIIFAGISVYLVFTKQAQAVQLFNFPGISVDVGQLMAGSIPPEAKQLGFKIPSQKQEFLSGEMINGPLNISMHLFLMGFIASIGGRLAQIGTYLLRPIVVKVKAKEENSK